MMRNVEGASLFHHYASEVEAEVEEARRASSSSSSSGQKGEKNNNNFSSQLEEALNLLVEEGEETFRKKLKEIYGKLVIAMAIQ
mmetsp:Transcript_31587/g.51097  ORF Transcript_31587/g.51097 Transcript_31587/m.51097 type:complete len:84 (+) Transcript_31587:978-1229(+)